MNETAMTTAYYPHLPDAVLAFLVIITMIGIILLWFSSTCKSRKEGNR